jgi:hypothetical protein
LPQFGHLSEDDRISHVQLSDLKFEEILPELTRECVIHVRHYGCRHFMQLKNMINEDMGEHGWGELVYESTKVSIFGDPINNHNDN